MMYAHSCAFSGNRDLPLDQLRTMATVLREQVALLVEKGVCVFYTGGALGFDTLAALTVIEERERSPHIQLHLTVPFKGQERFFSAEDKELFFDIMRQSDQVLVLEPQYTKAAYHARNRYMVDRCKYLISFNDKPRGGTAYTIDYALAKGACVIDLKHLLKDAM